MLKIEWRDTWLNTLIDAGISPLKAKDTFKAMYGLDGFDNTKNPSHSAHETLALIAKEKGI
jgi:hypothetical protein